MKELNQIEYENLRASGAKLIGRVIPYEASADIIYYMVSPEVVTINYNEP